LELTHLEWRKMCCANGLEMVKDICEELRPTKCVPFGDGLKDPIGATSLSANSTLHGKHKFTKHIKLARINAKEVKGNISKDQTSPNSSSSSNFCVCIPCHYSVIHIISVDDICTLWRCILWCDIYKRLWPGLRIATYRAGLSRAQTSVVHLA
jgi:hypothetical protein